MMRVNVAVTPNPYEVVIGSGLLAQVGARLLEVMHGRETVAIVTVAPVWRKWGKPLMQSLTASGFRPYNLQMPDGEPAKKLAVVEQLAEKLVRCGLDRSSVVIAFGGGVVGDTAGLLASLYMRGVRLVQIPTTVLAQVDASIGGKTGVNLKAGKNLLGTFHQPRVVLIDPAILSSLPARQYRAGLYEALKCGIIGNSTLFQMFEDQKDKVLRRDAEILQWIIGESVKVKASIVAADEREGGLRQVLNFGHTVGHALEAEGKYRAYLHGEAVAWGMIAATNIALVTGKVSSVTAGRITDAVLGLGKLPAVKAKPASLLRLLRNDKKTRDGIVHFVVPRDIGQVEVVKGIPDEVILEALSELRRFSGQ